MSDFGRVHAIVVATKDGGRVVLERYYARLTELQKAEVREAFAAAAAGVNLAHDSHEFVGSFRGAPFVLLPATDLVFYALGCGEYDEMALTGILRVVILSLAEALGRPPTESVLFERHARAAVVIDEIVNEGMLEAVDRDAVRKGAKGKGFWE